MFAIRHAVTAGRVTLAALALVLLLGVVGLPAIAAETAVEVSVVRELTEERTATSKTYLLSDDTRRALLFEAPVHYRDARGEWIDLDTALTASVSLDAVSSTSTPAAVTLGSQALDSPPVTIAYEDACVGFDLLAVAESAPLALGDEATYFDVA